jgi:shikimate dehydrogenase
VTAANVESAGGPSASTRLAGVIGHPVRHSLSPRLHQAAYRVLGLDWTYLAFDVAPGSIEAAVEGASALGLVGLSVTMPHKEAAARLATRRSPMVRRLGAANTLTFLGRRVVADNTDGAGLIADLRQGVPFEPSDRRCAVIGAGGAARAAIVALAEAGAREVLVVNRTPARAIQAATLAPGRGRVARPEELDAADLIVNATPIGMLADGGRGGTCASEVLVDSSRFGSGQLVVDLVYDPPVTEWLAQAASNGARVRGGLGMLVHQAALQVEIWTGSRAPLGEMWKAAEAHTPTRS